MASLIHSQPIDTNLKINKWQRAAEFPKDYIINRGSTYMSWRYIIAKGNIIDGIEAKW